MEADGVDYSGLYDLSPREDSPGHSDGLGGVTVGQVLCALWEMGEEEILVQKCQNVTVHAHVAECTCPS